MKPSLIAVLFASILSITVLPGCSLFQNACNTVMPVLTAGQAYSADAQQALDQVQAIVNGMTITADKKKIVQDGINNARVALRTANALIATASETCKSTDVLQIFKDFNNVWSILKGLIGANVGPGLIGAAPGSATGIVDPAIYRKAGGT